MTERAFAEEYPSQQDLFSRLADVAAKMTMTCSDVEAALASDTSAEAGQTDSAALQNLDRMTQNLGDLANLLNRLASAQNHLDRRDIKEAIDAVLLPSLRGYLSSGEEQSDQSNVELF